MYKIPISLLIVIMLSSIAIAYGQQPYMGGYLRDNVTATNRVHLAVTVSGTHGEYFASTSWLMGVASVAGANSTTLTGWTYQNPVVLVKNTSVWWAPQAWLGGIKSWYYSVIVGEQLWVAFHLRMDIVAHSNVTFKCFAYHYTWQYGPSDAPIIYTWSNATTDNNFLVGRQTIDNTAYKHFQFGVESNSAITNQSWSVINKKPCYYNGTSWLYRAANVTWGSTSAITRYNNQPVSVGGIVYTGVNQDFVSNDFVTWKFTNTTIADDSQLWGSGGVVTDVVKFPYL